jgi:hypothetical protein
MSAKANNEMGLEGIAGAGIGAIFGTLAGG